MRYDLMGKNKTGKYLKYAIGEIILVVIGILIALQINNWNENRKSKTIEKEYLNGMLRNLKSDINELDRHIGLDTIRFDAYTYLIRTFSSNSSTSIEQEIVSNINSIMTQHWFEGQNTVFEDMKSSGKLYFITSDTLRIAIQKYYGLFKEVIKQEDLVLIEIKKYSQQEIPGYNTSSFFEPLFPDRWNGNTGPPSLSFMKNPDFNNIKLNMIDDWSTRKAYEFSAHNVRVKLNQEATSLSKMIEQYLTDKK